MCAERYNQIHGGKDIKSRTIDKTRLDATSEITGYVLKVQSDGSLDFEAVIANLNDIGDVEVPTPSEGDRLRYDSGSGKWKNSKMEYVLEFRSYLLEG